MHFILNYYKQEHFIYLLKGIKYIFRQQKIAGLMYKKY